MRGYQPSWGSGGAISFPLGARGKAPGHQLELGIVATNNTLNLAIVVTKREIIINIFIRMGGQKLCLGDIYMPLSPPEFATVDKPNATY